MSSLQNYNLYLILKTISGEKSCISRILILLSLSLNITHAPHAVHACQYKLKDTDTDIHTHRHISIYMHVRERESKIKILDIQLFSPEMVFKIK